MQKSPNAQYALGRYELMINCVEVSSLMMDYTSFQSNHSRKRPCAIILAPTRMIVNGFHRVYTGFLYVSFISIIMIFLDSAQYFAYSIEKEWIALSQTNVSIRMDNDLKEQFSAFCADMGMSMTTAFNIFARKTVREYRIPFEIGGNPPNAETLEALDEVRRMKADPNLGKRYTDVDAMMKDLLA